MLRREVPPERTAEYARAVERLGLDELWVVEDCFFAGGIASVTAALAATDRIAVGIGVLPAVMRNVAATALEVAALARMFPGRLLPGIGHGVSDWMRQIGAFPASQLAALEEVTSALRSLLAGERVSMAGKHVHLDEVALEFPPAVVPPVATGVRAVRSLRTSGRVADGTVLTEMSAPGYVRWAREQIDAGRAEAGRTDAHRVTVYAFSAPDGPWGAGRDAAAALVAPALRSGSLDLQLAEAGIGAAAADLVRGTPDAAATAAALPAEWLDLLTVSGDPARCRRSLDALYDAGADAVVLVPAAADPDAALAQLAAVVS